MKMVLHPLSEILEWDEALGELGIQDSNTTPAEAVRELNAEIERLHVALAATPAGLIRCTCPCSCDETPHDGKPCLIHDAATPAVGGGALRAAMHINAKDREYADELLNDLDDDFPTNTEIVAQWFCKVRYETLRAAQPASPLRGRDAEAASDAIMGAARLYTHDHATACKITEMAMDAIFSASPPEQPAAAGSQTLSNRPPECGGES